MNRYRRLFVPLLLLLPACAGYSGRGLHVGIATLPEVLASMGLPSQRWRDADGSEQLAYARGPEGTQTYMVFMTPDERLARIEAVLDSAHFAHIESGKSDQQSVLRLIGPPVSQWTTYFEARRELVWEWRFCDSWQQLARFNVAFDASSGLVRTAQQRQEILGSDGMAPFCGH